MSPIAEPSDTQRQYCSVQSCLKSKVKGKKFHSSLDAAMEKHYAVYVYGLLRENMATLRIP